MARAFCVVSLLAPACLLASCVPARPPAAVAAAPARPVDCAIPAPAQLAQGVWNGEGWVLTWGALRGGGWIQRTAPLGSGGRIDEGTEHDVATGVAGQLASAGDRLGL